MRDALEYLAWLSEETGKWYRLPTEVEWEYAARAGIKTQACCGEMIASECANFNWDQAEGKRMSLRKTTPVGEFHANPWGLYDTLGNTWEWTSSTVSNQVNRLPKAAVANDQEWLLCGGSWINVPEKVRFNTRIIRLGRKKSNFIGIRVLRETEK